MPYACAILLVAVIVLIFAVIHSLSSSGDGLPNRVPVSGIVLIDDKPLGSGTVRVFPAGHREASGQIGPDGRFALGMFEPGDGCVVGAHPAEVNAVRVINGGAQEWLAPKKYANAKTSGLTVQISGPTNDLRIKISWEGNKPFVENGSGQTIDFKGKKPTGSNQL